MSQKDPLPGLQFGQVSGQQRIIKVWFGKGALAQAGNTYELENEAPRLFDRSHEDAAEPFSLRLAAQRSQIFAENPRDVRQCHRTKVSHWLKFIEQIKNTLWIIEGRFRQRAKSIKPLAPQAWRAQLRKTLDQRQRERG